MTRKSRSVERGFSFQTIMEQIAIQGIAGCYHETAARGYFADREIEVLPCLSFDELFARMAADPALLGIAAIENTIAGSLLPNHELLQQQPRRGSSANRNSASRTCWRPFPGRRPTSIARSPLAPDRPDAVRRFPESPPRHEDRRTGRHGRQRRARSPRDASQDTAAICGADCGPISTDSRSSGGASRPTNTTSRASCCWPTSCRADGHSPIPPTPTKPRSLFTLPHTRGSLSKVLTVLSFYDINLTKIQSLPIIGREWEYRFYVDVTFDDPMRYRQAIDAVTASHQRLPHSGRIRRMSQPHNQIRTDND